MNSIEQGKPGGETKPQVTEQMQKVLDDVKKNGSVTETEIGELLNVRSTRSYAIVRKMCTFGLLVSQGRGKNKKYYLNM